MFPSAPVEWIPLYKIQQPSEAASVEPGNQHFSEKEQQNCGSKGSEIIFLYSKRNKTIFFWNDSGQEAWGEAS